MHEYLIPRSAWWNDGEENVMSDMMGGMGWPMELFGLIGAVVLLLVVAALVKYVFFR